MKSTGIVRKVDELGRVVLPVELRRGFNINEKDGLEIFIEEDTIVLKKYAPHCILCENVKNTVHIKGKLFCQDCLQTIREAGR